MEETCACSSPSPEDEFIDAHFGRPEREAKEERRRELGLRALNALTDVQRRRYLLYKIDGMTEEEIADLESTTHQAVSKSLISAKRKIQKILTDG